MQTSPGGLPGLPFDAKQLTIGLFVLAGLFAAIPLGIFINAKGSWQAAFGPVFLWGCVLTAEALAAAVVNVSYTPEVEGRATSAEKARLVLLFLGGSVGLATAVLGAALPFTTFSEQLKGGLESWRANPKGLIWSSLALLGGLGLMFVSLQLGRGMERTSQSMRRLIYGYNAVLTGLLLLAVLALPNVLSYAAPFSGVMGATDDWTKSRVYTLQPATRTYLRELEAPVRVVLLLDPADPLYGEMNLLLDNVLAVTNKVSRDSVAVRRGPQGVDARLLHIMENYNIPNPYGVLVLVGEGKDEKHDFIPADDLAGGRGRSEEGSYFFTGEQAVLNSIKFLAEGKAVIYFTQGSGEPGLAGGRPMMPGQPPQEGGLSMLRRRLTQRKGFEVKELRAEPGLKDVPEDASVVVVAGPTREMPKEMVQALERYLNRRENEKKGIKAGKLFVLVGPVAQRVGESRTLVKTGLEGLLAKYSVKLGNDVIYNSLTNDPRFLNVVEAVTDPESPNPVAKAFDPAHPVLRTLFTFYRARTVSPAPAGPGGSSGVEKLLVTNALRGYWAETDQNVSPVEKRNQLVRWLRSGRPEEIQKWREVAGSQLSLGVTVTAGVPGLPGDRAHAGLQKPRMVVIGNAWWITDRFLEGEPRSYDLFENCVAWLRERPTVGKTEPPEEGPKKPYKLEIPAENQTRMTWLPLVLMGLGVLGLGCGVWVVRRR
jgi:hypothetical protein